MRSVELSRRQPAAHHPLGRHAALYLAALPLAWAAGSLQALGLGDISSQSGLGRPLRLVVPIIADVNDALSGDCFKLAPTGRDADGVPELQAGRVALERVGARAQLVVSSTRAVNDPLLRLTVQAGCDNPIRREYVLLLDPVPIEAPVVANEDAASRTALAAPIAAAGVRANAGTRRDATGTRAGGNSRGRAAIRSRAPMTRAAVARAVPPADTDTAQARRPTPQSKASAPRIVRVVPPANVSPQPRLTVSTSAPATVVSGKSVAETRELDSQETANALEAETLVLRQRVAQLSEMVDKLQSEMQAAQSAQAARLAAEEAARSTPQAILGRWWNGSWPIFAAVFGLAALVAVGLGWKRRRSMPGSTVWPDVIAPSDGPAAPPGTSTVAVASTAPRAESSPPARPLSGPVADDASVAVSEPSHVTEEAGVYLAFNRADRAIEVLREHIRTQPRSLPGPWLMLLDVYRSNGRELEFRQLATEFQRRFNAPPPNWDADSQTAQDGGALAATTNRKPPVMLDLERALDEDMGSATTTSSPRIVTDSGGPLKPATG